VIDPSAPAVIDMVDVVLSSYFISPVSEPKLTNPDEVQDVIKDLKVSKVPGPNGIPKRALKRLPQRVVSLLAQTFNALLLTHHFPTMLKHARVISILKPWKDPALSSFYRPVSLLDTIGKIFEKILLVRILHELSERGLLRDEQFRFIPRHSTSVQLARLVERITRNFGEKRLTGAVNDLQQWLTEWKIAINVSKSTAIIFARAGRHFNQPRPVTLGGEPIEWVDTTRYLG
jgi:hypothetical protein